MLTLQNHCVLVFLMLFIFCFHPHLTFSAPSAVIPHPQQCHALLQFKSSFVINASASGHCYYESPHPKTESWKENTDCCSSWEGVTCDAESGRVIELNLSCSHLQGTIHSNSSLFSSHLAPYLRKLNLAFNDFQGSKMSSEFGVKFCSSLTHLDLSESGFSGNIPSEISLLSNIVSLDLSSYYHPGLRVESERVVERIAQNLTRLRVLSLGGVNMSSVHASNNNISSSTSIYTNLTYSLPSLELLDLSGCNLKQFPAFIKALTSLKYLFFYNNQIQGSLPEWIYDVGRDTLSVIDLSENLLTSVGRQLHWKNIKIIYFHSNHLQGPLPIPPTSTTIFSVSNNSLSGEISSLICNLSQLQSLDLSHNKFIGLIPQCLGSLSNLSTLNLGVNNLHGRIPNTFAKHNNLNSLVLKGNQLTGTMPQTLSYSHNLQILDVGNNMIHDTVPHWLETLSSLQVLVLRSNKFYGFLNFKDKLLFPALRILDLSNNNFVGRLPYELLKNLNAMTKVNESFEDDRKYLMDPIHGWYYSMTTIVKGYEMEYIRILTALVTIDLSRNKFEGHIPGIIGKLISLKGLNLSYNLLTGHIPSSMGGLGNLEWLDLSHNKLSGQIPRELSDLHSLGALNLSSNQLHGEIPQDRHFDTFGNDSYKDNLALCGFPLTKTCGPDHEPPLDASDDKSSSDSEGGFSWEGAFIGFGCGIVFGLSLGYLVFTTRSPKWFVKKVEGKEHGRVG